MLIGVLAALAAATFYAAGVALQSLDARQAHSDDVLRASLIVSLLQRPRWLIGSAVSLIGWPLQALALAEAPLAVVQPALAFNLVVLLVIARRLTPDAIPRADVLGAFAITLGVVALSITAPSRGGEAGSRTVVLVAVLGAISALPLVFRHLTRRVAILVPAIAGVGFTLLAIATRLAEDSFGDGRYLPCACWLVVAGLSAYAATVCEMSAMHTRAATLVVPVTVSVESVLPIIVAPLALSEHLPMSTGSRAILVAGLLLIVGGVSILGRTPALADLRHEPGVTPI